MDHLASKLGLPLTLTHNRPFLYLRDEEKGWINQVAETTGYKGKFWLINSGYKNDFTIKKWRLRYWEETLAHLTEKYKMVFIQVGEKGHNHKPIAGAINFIGKTDSRQLIRLAYHASGAIRGCAGNAGSANAGSYSMAAK